MALESNSIVRSLYLGISMGRKKSKFSLCASLLVCGLSFLYSHSTYADSASDQAMADQYAEWFKAEFLLENLVGAAFAVVSRDGILSSGSFGYTDTSHKQEVNQDTVFRIASVSKTFAAGLTALLVADGSLAWTDPVNRYVPTFHIKGDTSKIRIEDLLGQSSGLISHAYDNLIEDGVPTNEIYTRLSDLPYTCSPGSCYSYQNSVFSLIQPVVESISAQSYESLVEQRIFKPLDMQTASVGYEPFLANSNRAMPHVKGKSRWLTVQVLPNYYRVAPAAGVNASITDMAKWLRAQLVAEPLMLSPDAQQALIAPRVRTPRELQRREWNKLLTDAHYGLGWRVYQLGEQRIAYHSGWVSGYRADIAYSLSEGIGITVLLNAESSAISRMTTQFWQLANARKLPDKSLAKAKAP
jgi:beta-lactamase class C